MSCPYCTFKSKYHDGKHWKHEYGCCGCISHENDYKTPLIAVWDENNPSRSLLLIEGVKYCPFCGGKIVLSDKERPDESAR